MHDDRVPVKNVGPDLLADMQYEHRDVAQKKLWGWIGAFYVMFVASMFVAAGIYWLFIPNWYKLGQVPAPSPYRRLPPHPQVQVDPRRDMELFRQAETRETSGLEGAMPGTKPAMTVDEAINKLAGQDGIAGIKGTAIPERGTGYPGGRQFGPEGSQPHDGGKQDVSGGEHGGDHANVEHKAVPDATHGAVLGATPSASPAATTAPAAVPSATTGPAAAPSVAPSAVPAPPPGPPAIH